MNSSEIKSPPIPPLHRAKPPPRSRTFWLITTTALAIVLGFISWHYDLLPLYDPADPAIIEKLKSAQHYRSTFPAPTQSFNLARTVSLKTGLLNALGREPRDVSNLSGGYPPSVFAALSHFVGYEVIWVDNWSNFPIHLPPTTMPGLAVAPRNVAVRAMLDAIQASGGCLVKAGPHRYLVAKISEKQKYQAALHALGWLRGTRAPWETNGGATTKP